jgi:hypothetical protein
MTEEEKKTKNMLQLSSSQTPVCPFCFAELCIAELGFGFAHLAQLRETHLH